jgi:tetratricopeptide (TPR) repeat protein
MKKLILSLLPILLAGAIAGGFWFYKNKHKNQNTATVADTASINNYDCRENNDNFKKSTNLVISKELKEKYENQIKDALKDKQEDDQYYMNLGILYRSVDDLKNSCLMFNQARSLNGNNFVVISALGTVFEEMGDYDQAEVAFLETLKVNSEDDNTYVKLGMLYRSGKIKKTVLEIRTFYADGIKKTKGRGVLPREYATYLEEIKEYATAKSLWEAILKQGGSDSNKEIIQAKINYLATKIK